MAEQERNCKTCGNGLCEVRDSIKKIIGNCAGWIENKQMKPKEQEKSYEEKIKDIKQSLRLKLHANMIHPEVDQLEQLALAEGERRATERIVKIIKGVQDKMCVYTEPWSAPENPMQQTNNFIIYLLKAIEGENNAKD